MRIVRRQSWFGGAKYRAIEARILRGERPAEFEECLAMMAYALGSYRIELGQPHRALPLLETSNAWAQEFGFCDYWRPHQHLHMRSLLVTTTASVRGLAEVPTIPPDLLMPGTTDYLSALSDSGGEWFIADADVHLLTHAEVADYLGHRQYGSHTFLLDGNPQAIHANELDLPWLQDYAAVEQPRNVFRAARANMLLAVRQRQAGQLDDEQAVKHARRASELSTGVDQILAVRARLELGAILLARGETCLATETRQAAEADAEKLAFGHLLSA